MGWIVGVLIAIGSLFSYMGIKNQKIRKLEYRNKNLQQHTKKAQLEHEMQQQVVEIQGEVREDQIQQTQKVQDLKETIPEGEQSEELSDEGKQSAAAISGHILDRYRQRMSDGSRD